MSDRETEKKLLDGIENKSENARVLEMTEQGNSLGWVAVDLIGSTLKMLEFHVEAQSDMERVFYMDTLMRSAASYGETKGADQLVSIATEWNDFFAKRGFRTDEEGAYAPMSLIVHYE